MPNTSTVAERSYMALSRIVDQHEQKLRSLKYDCECLIRKLERTMKECEDALAGKPHSINSLGVIQGNGLDIDRQCAEIRILSDAIGNMRYVIGNDDE